MPKSRSNLADLFRRTGKFKHVHEIDKSIFLVNEICDLTGFCVPIERKMFGSHHIRYDFGLTVASREMRASGSLESNLVNRSFVILPKTTPPKNTLDTFVYDNQISDWLIDDMLSTMEKYCLSHRDAISLITEGNDRFLNSLQRVYQDRLDHKILHPLSKLA